MLITEKKQLAACGADGNLWRIIEKLLPSDRNFSHLSCHRYCSAICNSQSIKELLCRASSIECSCRHSPGARDIKAMVGISLTKINRQSLRPSDNIPSPGYIANTAGSWWRSDDREISCFCVISGIHGWQNNRRLVARR